MDHLILNDKLFSYQIKEEIIKLFTDDFFKTCVSIYDLLIWFQLLDIIKQNETIQSNVPNTTEVFKFKYLSKISIYSSSKNITLLHTTIDDIIIILKKNKQINKSNFLGSENIQIILFGINIQLTRNESPFLNLIRIRNALFKNIGDILAL